MILKQDNYRILKRHNFNQLAKTFNNIREYAKTNDYDALMILESDIVMKKSTLTDLHEGLSNYDVMCCYFDIPWEKKPVVVKKYPIPHIINPENYNYNNILSIVGTGTGCVLINKKALNVKFDVKTYKGVTGQDVGFYYNLHKNGYSVGMVTKYKLEHLYNRLKT
jgi:hypothetical protein